jgi:hypothetical protein
MSGLYEPTYSFPNMNGELKLREAIIFIAERSASDPGFGAIKLNKILHRADLRSFVQYGRPLTGVEYQALTNGPAPRRLLPIKKQMLQAGEIDEDEREVGGHTQVRIIAKRPHDPSVLTESDVEILNIIISELWGRTAVDVSEASHGRAWRIARKGDDLIPYEAAFLSEDNDAHPEDRWRAEELARQFGWRR